MTNPADEPASGLPAPAAGPDGPADLAARVEQDVATLDTELAEIDLLIQQASAEGERHEAKRSALADQDRRVQDRRRSTRSSWPSRTPSSST